MQRSTIPQIKVTGARINFNRPARAALGDPESVHLTNPENGVVCITQATDQEGKNLNSSFTCSAATFIYDVGLRQGLHQCSVRGKTLTVKFDRCNTWRDGAQG